MAELQQFLEERVKVRVDFVEQHVLPIEQDFKTFIKDFDTYAKALIKAKKTGNFKPVGSKKAKVRESIKENTWPNNDAEKNKVFYKNNTDTIKVKTEKLSIVASSTKNVDKEDMPAPKILPPRRKVKKEKESINVKATRGRDNSEAKRTTRSHAASADRNSDVILESTPVPIVDLSDSEEEKKPEVVRSTRTRTKKNDVTEESTSTTTRSTRTKTKNKIQLENESVSASVNIINETKSILNSGDESSFNFINVNTKTTDLKKAANISDQPVRMTRTKTKVKPKRERSESEELDAKSINHKRSKSATKSDNEEVHTSVRTEYEDALSELDIGKNSTFVLPAKAAKGPQTSNEDSSCYIANKTVVLDNQNTAQSYSNNHVNDILTDDESYEEPRAVSPQKGKKAKEVFSPYVRSPVKKKVEAFEKFQQQDVSEMTSKANTSRILREIEENKGNVKEKARGYTPLSSKTLYKNGPSSSTRIGKYIGNKPTLLNDSMSLFSKVTTPSKAPPLIKQASVDYHDKESKRLERERELKKQEMIKRAASADRKKRYELKMQQQKEAMEKEKLKILEAQRLKEERYKLLLQQKEEKQRQLKEEHEKKRLLAKQRAEEKRNEEEYQRMLVHQEKLKNEQMLRKKAEADDIRKKALHNSAETIPIYMTKPAPYLQCDDCYDSDDEEYSSKRNIPDWATKHRKFESDKTQTTLGHRIKNSFFCCQNHTVDLREIFQRIDPKKLKRTSSANWSRPPRFTMLPDCP